MSKAINRLMWLREQDEEQGKFAPKLAPTGAGAGAAEPVLDAGDNKEQPEGPQPLEPVPDVPTNDDEVPEFNKWRDEFFKLAIQGDAEKMLDHVNVIKDQKLDAAQTKFVDDNFKILLLRQDANFDKVSKSIRKSLKESLDKEHPGVSLIQVINPEIEGNPVLSEILVKLFGYHGLKGELHRKFIAALTGSVQVGGGGNKEDLVFNDKEYSINISTRMAANFGEITIGKWSLQSDDTSKFLAEPEQKRLQEGSPEERKALIHRIIMDSIADKFKTRAFIIHVVTADGNIYSLGWDLGECIKDAFTKGALVVKSDISSYSDVTINEDGEIIALKNMGIYAKVGENEPGVDGKVEEAAKPFIENRSGTLYFVADLETINKIVGNLSGIVMQSKPFTGSDEEFKKFTQCVPSLSELLLRRC